MIIDYLNSLFRGAVKPRGLQQPPPNNPGRGRMARINAKRRAAHLKRCKARK